jgi:hypothetical protein
MSVTEGGIIKIHQQIPFLQIVWKCALRFIKQAYYAPSISAVENNENHDRAMLAYTFQIKSKEDTVYLHGHALH